MRGSFRCSWDNPTLCAFTAKTERAVFQMPCYTERGSSQSEHRELISFLLLHWPCGRWHCQFCHYGSANLPHHSPLIERWRHAWCHSSHKRISSLNAPWHQGCTTLVPPRIRWCHQKRCAGNRMATRWHPFYLALPSSPDPSASQPAIIVPEPGNSAPKTRS